VPDPQMRFCASPGCPVKVPQGYCTYCRGLRNRAKGSATQRGYGADWERVRDAHRIRSPFCVECQKEGVTRVMDEVDHIVPFKTLDDPKRLDPNNLQSLCIEHHRRKQAGYPGGNRKG